MVIDYAQEFDAIVSREYQPEDFLRGTSLFERIHSFSNNPVMHEQLKHEMYKIARPLQINFRKLYSEYERSLKMAAADIYLDNATEFSGQPLELNAGDWRADDFGITRRKMGVEEEACCHPILPVERLVNIDTGAEKLKIAFSKGRRWREIVVNKGTLANTRNIVTLADAGIAVNSINAGLLVQYLHDMEKLNYDLIPERKSVTRVGWITDEGFAPYIGELVFDGSDEFGRVFKAIRQQGKLDTWKAEAIRARKYSLVAKIVLAASFASVLVEPMGCLPFFVHLWGMASETGKTVGQMLAASVWAEPRAGGEFFKTFRSTSVSFEVLAGFLHSLPVIIDELQLARDSRGKVIFNVYELAAGSGKMRSNTKLGIAATPRWANCFITSGETPITGEQDGAGAINRVIEVECLAGFKVIEDGHRTAELLKHNYGHAGKLFVENLCDPDVMEDAKQRYHELFRQYSASNATDKQSHAAALITLADELATKWIFQDSNPLTVSELSDFLKSREAVSAAERGYDYICDWVAQNANKFHGEDEKADVYGKLGEDGDAGWVFIIRSVFNKACEAEGISPRALLSHLRSKGAIRCPANKYTRTVKINKIPTECVVLRLRDDETQPDMEDLPF